MEPTRTTIETLKSNSFSGRYAGTGTDFKLYFDTIEQLKSGIDSVIEAKNYLAEQLKESETVNLEEDPK